MGFQDSLNLSYKALAILLRLKDDNSLEVASALEELASAEYHAGNLSRARDLGKTGLRVKEAILGRASSSTLDVKDHLAVTYSKQGDPETAACIHEEVRDLRRDTIGELHPNTLRTEVLLARAWRMGGHLEQAGFSTKRFYASQAIALGVIIETLNPQQGVYGDVLSLKAL